MSYGSIGSATKAVEVSKSDTTVIGAGIEACRALYVGGAGDLEVILVSDYDVGNPTSNSVTLVDVPSGSVLPLAVVKVLVATTATDIVALF